MMTYLLHFDLNKTIILKDTSKNMTADQTIISILAENTLHQWSADYPSMSFKHYVEKILYPGEKTSPELKQLRFNKIQEFLAFANQYPELHESVRKTYEAVKKVFYNNETDKTNFSIFPSFFKFLKMMRTMENTSFKIILRTFGNDLNEVVDEINRHPHGVTISKFGKFTNQQLQINGKILKKTLEIFEFLKQTPEHLAIQDNYQDWFLNHENKHFGKPFPYEAHSQNTMSFFFDDNLTFESEDIVNPEEIHGNALPTEQLKNRFLFQINPLEAILNEDYFINLFLNSLR